MIFHPGTRKKEKVDFWLFARFALGTNGKNGKRFQWTVDFFFYAFFLTDSIGNIHHFKSDRRFQEVLQKYLIQLKLFTFSCLQEIILQRQGSRKNVPQSNIRTTIPKHKHWHVFILFTCRQWCFYFVTVEHLQPPVLMWSHSITASISSFKSGAGVTLNCISGNCLEVLQKRWDRGQGWGQGWTESQFSAGILCHLNTQTELGNYALKTEYVVKHKTAKLFMMYAVGKLEAALNISHLILSTSSQRVS